MIESSDDVATGRANYRGKENENYFFSSNPRVEYAHFSFFGKNAVACQATFFILTNFVIFKIVSKLNFGYGTIF